MYKQLIECGIEVFWNAYEKNLSAVAGLNDNPNSDIIIFETYPRYVIKRLWSDEEIPSKRKAPIDYVRKFSFLIKQKGYSFHESKILSPDYIDAMVCAIAAEDYFVTNGKSAGKVGVPPVVDNAEKILREGFIYSP